MSGQNLTLTTDVETCTLRSWRWAESVRNSQIGRLIALVATTYELDSDFLMSDLLPTLLNVGSKKTSGVTSPYVITQSLRDCTVEKLFDSSQYDDARGISPRIDLIPCCKRVLHSKVSLIYWEGLLRLVITSANMTSEGFRKNREVAWSVDFNDKSTSDVDAFNGGKDSDGKTGGPGGI